MAVLQIIKGVNQGQEVPITGDRFVLGRNPDCHLVIPVTSVSREHAHILRVADKFYIEDMQSRNGTKVNNQNISARTLLKSDDEIQICDFVARFQEGPVRKPLPKELTREEDDGEADEGEGALLPEATISSHSSHLILEAQPKDKLNALLEISNNLSKTLEIDKLLPKIIDSLFQLFRQADRGFVILRDETGHKLLPKVVRTRRPQDEINARFSKSIVKQCLETLQALLSDDASSDKRFQLSQSVADFRIRSVMCAPLATGEGKSFGVIQLDTQDRGKKFTQDDLALLVAVASQAAIALENARLHEDAVARERLHRDLELAHQVQLSFLPKKLPEVSAYEFYAHYQSAQQVGGDYYGFIPMADGRLAVLLGDVAGKGVPAALLMAKLSSDAHFSLLTADDLAAAVAKLNRLLCEHTSEMDRFVTLAAALLDPDGHEVTLVSAGHPSPLLYRRDRGEVEEVVPRKTAGLPLGLMEDVDYTPCQVSLQPGDSILLFSDGVPDAYNARNEAFQVKGMLEALRNGGPHTARSAGERLVRAVKQHTLGVSQHDDITLVCFGRIA